MSQLAPEPEQLEFASLAFPKDRKVLMAGEVALRWGVSDQHVLDLLEAGQLHGFDISGNRKEFIRIPAAAVDAIAARFGVPREFIQKIIDSTPAQRKTTRANWRIPVEGYDAFIQENRS
jgi:hypothetical protein